MTGNYLDFRGIDLLTGFEKVVGRVLLKNELGGLSDGYQISFAEIGDGGYSFGGNQLDLHKNTVKAKSVLIDILNNARDSNGNLIFPEGGTQAYENNKAGLESFVGHKLLIPQESLINEALSSSYGKEKLNQDFKNEVSEKISYIDNIINSLPDGNIKITLQNSEELKAYLVDYHNQFGLDNGGKMHQFLQGKLVSLSSGNPPVLWSGKLEGNMITSNDIISFVSHTDQSVKYPNPFHTRYNGTKSTLLEEGIGKFLLGNNQHQDFIGTQNNDTINGGGGSDSLSGGLGSDTYVFSDNFGNDTINDDGSTDIIKIGSAVLSGQATFEHTGENGEDVYNLGSYLLSYSGTTLNIYSETNSIAVTNFSSGDYGITLETKPEDGDPEDDVNPNDDFVGTSGDDSINGTSGNDTISGGAGNDTINSGSGDDRIFAGSGNDIVNAGDGNDHVYGGSGNDTIHGGTGNDFLDGGTGNDTIFGDEGNDIIFGGTGDDNLSGGSGDDYLIGDDGNDFLDGGSGNDVLAGESGADTYSFSGNFGNDLIDDTGAGDQIVINGNVLSGEATYTADGIYKLGDYIVNYDGSTLTILTPGGNIFVDYFDSGNYGITIQEKPDPEIGDGVGDFLHRFTQAEATMPAIRRYDPLTLDLNHNGQIDLISLANSNTFFDITGNGLQNKVGWVGNGGTGTADGFLVLDANNNGKVDNVEELFGHGNSDGSETLGTEELATYDTNSDGKIDANDAVFSDLKVWQDANGNGQTDAGELKTLSDLNITAIDLDVTTTNQIINGNKIISTGSYEYNDDQNNPQTAKIANLDLAIDFTNSRSYSYQDNQGNNISYTLNLETLDLPFSRGYGNAKAWHIAMSEDSTLLQMMKDIVNVNNPDLQSDPENLVTYSNLNSKIEEFIYRWTGTDEVTGMRGAFDGKQLAAMEAIRGIIYTDFSGSHDVAFLNSGNTSNIAMLQSAWSTLISDITSKILVQGILKSDYPNSYYDFSSDSIVYNDGDKQIDSVIFGTAGNDVGNNALYGSGYNLNSSPNLITKNDILIGGHGDDLLVGGKGDDIYLYSKGDGFFVTAKPEEQHELLFLTKNEYSAVPNARAQVLFELCSKRNAALLYSEQIVLLRQQEIFANDNLVNQNSTFIPSIKTY